ncbi:MAG TPA: hypothetical protein H9870_08925 [Candidatus Corynebacterium avicola]|uniref:DUF3558 domain-containing protein n=1 Tax=Candidatus Corynebacterium avicola TaxID=2838527 RepID=A0A9D1ULI3_9CORY|nr:hypothetical protein [Candidatus Corynebacterium avicola]
MGHILRRTLRFTAVATTLTVATALTACGGDDTSDDGGQTSAAQGDDLDLPEFEGLTDIRDTLADGGYECEDWSEVEEKGASCVLPDEGGVHGIYISDNPTATTTVLFRNNPESPGVVIGGNWVFDCGPDDSLGSEGCGEISDVLGGMQVEPDPE